MISVSPLAVDEWHGFAAIRLEALENNPGVFSSNYVKEAEYGEPEWREWLFTKGKCFFCLKDDARIVGIIGIVTRALDPSGKTGMIVSVYISPDYRGRGYSDLIYRACIEWGIGYHPWEKIVVAHRADNDASRRAIQKQGFVVTHNEARVWPDGTACDEIWYQMDLKSLRKNT